MAGASGVLAIGLGVFITSIGLGILRYPEEEIHAPLWVIAASGIAFVFAGIAVLQQTFGIETLKYVPGIAILLTVGAVAHWVAFGPGDRKGVGVLTIVGIPIPVSSEILGRIGFGFGAVLIDTLLIVGIVRWLRSMLSR